MSYTLGQAARVVGAWAGEMGLPSRLRDAGVREEQLAELAALAFANQTVRNNPRPIRDAAEIETVLRAAW